MSVDLSNANCPADQMTKSGVRAEVEELAKLGPLPSENEAEVGQLAGSGVYVFFIVFITSPIGELYQTRVSEKFSVPLGHGRPCGVRGDLINFEGFDHGGQACHCGKIKSYNETIADRTLSVATFKRPWANATRQIFSKSSASDRTACAS